MKKKLFRSFTFYFMLLSLFMIYTHYIGRDSHGIVLFHLNIIMRSLLYSEAANSIVKLGPKIACGSLAGEIYVFWYIAHFISFVAYGLVLDFLGFGIRKISNLVSRGIAE